MPLAFTFLFVSPNVIVTEGIFIVVIILCAKNKSFLSLYPSCPAFSVYFSVCKSRYHCNRRNIHCCNNTVCKEQLLNCKILKHTHVLCCSRQNAVVPDECVLKVFKTTLAEFRNRWQYVRGDVRFFKDEFKKQNPRKIMKIWAEKEMINLQK